MRLTTSPSKLTVRTPLIRGKSKRSDKNQQLKFSLGKNPPITMPHTLFLLPNKQKKEKTDSCFTQMIPERGALGGKAVLAATCLSAKCKDPETPRLIH